MTRIITLVTLLISILIINGLAQEYIPVKSLANIPKPMANNATAILQTGNMITLFSFKGMTQSKRWQESSLESFALSSGNKNWRRIASVPGDKGEFAATAISLNDRVFVFGGYAIGANRTEYTVPQSFEYDIKTNIYTLMPEIPVAVDDSVSFTVADRYIYLISGWHNSGNVNLSQVYDTVEKKWFQATAYPGNAVFGHAGAAVGNRFVICDGVEKIMPLQGRHHYQNVTGCFRGEVDPAKPQKIKWQRIVAHPGKPLYRMAAGGYQGQGGWIVFAGGSDNPYDYSGIGYNEVPSEPSNSVMAYSLNDNEWQMVGQLEQGSMDHRGLLVSGNKFYIIGGMITEQKVTNRVTEFCLSDKNGKLSPC